jgi:hypothetical protein
MKTGKKNHGSEVTLENTLEMVSQEKLFEVGPVGSLIQQSVHYVPKSLTPPLVQAKNGDQPIWK